jgi:hypothetical protein
MLNFQPNSCFQNEHQPMGASAKDDRHGGDARRRRVDAGPPDAEVLAFTYGVGRRLARALIASGLGAGRLILLEKGVEA